MVKVGELIAYLKLDTTDFKKNSELANIQTSKLAENVTLLVGGFAAAAGASYMLSEKYGGMAQELKDLSYQTGLSTDEVQKLQYAAVLAGANFGVVSTALNRLTISMSDAKDQTGEAYKAFAAIGVDPTGKSPKEVFDETAAALSNMADESERNAAANTLFGRSYKDLIPFMKTYVDNAKEIEKHPGLTKKEIQDLENAKIAWDRLTSSFTIYSGKVIAFLEDLRIKVNRYNPVLRLLGIFSGQDVSIDPSVNVLQELTGESPAAGGGGSSVGGGMFANRENPLTAGKVILSDAVADGVVRGLTYVESGGKVGGSGLSSAATAAVAAAGGTAIISPEAWRENYGSVNPASATQTTLDNSMQVRGSANTLSRRVAKIAMTLNKMSGNLTPAARLKLQSYFAGAGEPDLNGNIGGDYTNFQLERYEDIFNSEFRRLTRGTNPMYDANGNIIVYMQVDGQTIAKAVVDKLALLGVKV